jgi:predicted XRE-type DNA-binding protein
MTKIEKSSGNVFADIGIPDPETHALKATLVMRIDRLIKQRRLNQVAAAELLGISQPDVSKMLKGQFRAFSLERLMRFLVVLGQDVEIAVKKPASKRRQGKLTVAA